MGVHVHYSGFLYTLDNISLSATHFEWPYKKVKCYHFNTTEYNVKGKDYFAKRKKEKLLLHLAESLKSLGEVSENRKNRVFFMFKATH